MPRLSEASTSGVDPSLLVVLLRGGIDGLSVAAPVHDKTYQDVRRRLALRAQRGEAAGQLLQPASEDAAIPVHVHERETRPSSTPPAFLCRIGHTSTVRTISRIGMAGIDPLPGDGWIDCCAFCRRPIRSASGAPFEIGTAPRILQPGIGGLQPPERRKCWAGTPTCSRTSTRTTTAVVQGSTTRAIAGLSERPRSGLATRALAEAGAAHQTRCDGLARRFTRRRPAVNPGGPRIAVLSVYGWDSHVDEGVLDGDFGTNLADLICARHVPHDHRLAVGDTGESSW